MLIISSCSDCSHYPDPGVISSWHFHCWISFSFHLELNGSIAVSKSLLINIHSFFPEFTFELQWIVMWIVRGDFEEMETCVLIPQELSLALTARLSNQDSVTVFSNARIPQGTVLYPFQGTVRLDKIRVNGCLNDNDVSTFLKLSRESLVVALEGATGPVAANRDRAGPFTWDTDQKAAVCSQRQRYFIIHGAW